MRELPLCSFTIHMCYKGLCPPPFELKIHRVRYSARHRAIACVRYVAHCWAKLLSLYWANFLTWQRHNTENLKQIFPGKKLRAPQSQFPQSCVCERFIYFHNRSAYSAAICCMKILDRCWEYINRSQTNEMKLGLRPRNSQIRNT